MGISHKIFISIHNQEQESNTKGVTSSFYFIYHVILGPDILSQRYRFFSN